MAAGTDQPSTATSAFARERHVAYFVKALRGLPAPYAPQEVNRLTLVYFAVMALDLLGALDQVDKEAIVEWVYSLQVLSGPEGEGDAGGGAGYGFRGSPSVGIHYQPGGSQANPVAFDGGHLAATYSALAVLLALGDDLARVARAPLLASLPRLQLPDGSFMPVHYGAEADMRFVFCAAAISAILGDWRGLDRGRALDFVRRSQAYDGGFGLSPGLEAHGGAMYCAVAALKLMGGWDGPEWALPHNGPPDGRLPGTAGPSEPRVPTNWGRREEPASARADPPQRTDAREEPERGGGAARWHAAESRPLPREQFDLEAAVGWCVRRQSSEDGGLQGRCNKDSDACYGFWVGGSLQVLGAEDLLNKSALTGFLLTCQHKERGGFSKWPNGGPDLLHSLYAICSLSLLGQFDLKPICCHLGISADAASRLRHLQGL